MWEQIANLAISNGLFAVLFLGLLIYQLRDSRTREQKYQETIARLGKNLDIVNDIKDNVVEVKQMLKLKESKKVNTDGKN